MEKVARLASDDTGQNQLLTASHEVPEALVELLEAVGGDRGVATRLVREFLASYRDGLDGISAGVSAGQAEELGRRAHQFKGCLGIFCRTEPLELTQRLIDLAEGNSLEETPRVLEQLEIAMEKLGADLRGFVAGPSRGVEKRMLTVLIAEDDPIIRSFMVAMTGKIGHRVIAALDGQQALELWESERPHLILMDVQMPILDGLEATRRIRSRERELGGEVPIYGLTAHVMKEDVELCLSAGMTGHFGKPINFRALKETLEQHRAAAVALDALQQELFLSPAL